MKQNKNRRDFLKTAAIAGAGLYAMPNIILAKGNRDINDTVSIAFIGVGNRGRSHVRNIAKREDVIIPAICDINPEAVSKTQKILEENGKKKAAVFTKSEYAYLDMLEREDIDAVVISTPWLWHTRMAVASMKAGKYTGLEVSAANTIEECWDLVNTHEETGSNLMLLENVCYAREAMAALRMLREGVLGIPVHATCGYKHDLREVKFNDGVQYHGGGVEFGQKAANEARWRTQHSLKRDADVYPTHGIAPVGNWLDINRGNRFVSLTATSTKSVGLNEYIVNHPKGGPDHPNAKLEWKLGDIVTSVIRTASEESIIVKHDTNLPRPYSWGFTLQGSKGMWCGQYEGRRVYIEGMSESHKWTDGQAYDEFMKKYDHPLWVRLEQEAAESGHGGIDYFTARAFVESVKRKLPPPIDAYDAAAWSAITPLSEASIADGSNSKLFPDFTRGRWINNKPIFGLSDDF
jgi:hypothetical protein